MPNKIVTIIIAFAFFFLMKDVYKKIEDVNASSKIAVIVLLIYVVIIVELNEIDITRFIPKPL